MRIARLIMATPLLMPLAVPQAFAGASAIVDVTAAYPDLDPGKTRIILFRESHFMGMGEEARIKLRGKTIGSISDGVGIWFDCNPGDIEVDVDSPLQFGHLAVPLEAKAGNQYFIELAAQEWSGGGAVGYLASTMKSKVDQFCSSGWCAGILDKNDALPKLQHFSIGRVPVSD